MPSEHTPEPWEFVDDGEGGVVYITADHAGTTDICDLYHVSEEGGNEHVFRKANAAANGERIVACVNACEGVADPAALRAQRDALRAMVRECRKCLANPGGYKVMQSDDAIARIDQLLRDVDESEGGDE